MMINSSKMFIHFYFTTIICFFRWMSSSPHGGRGEREKLEISRKIYTIFEVCCWSLPKNILTTQQRQSARHASVGRKWHGNKKYCPDFVSLATNPSHSFGHNPPSRLQKIPNYVKFHRWYFLSVSAASSTAFRTECKHRSGLIWEGETSSVSLLFAQTIVN